MKGPSLQEFQGGGKDEDIIKVDDHKVVKKFSENIFHKVLERGWSITQSERHDEIFEASEQSSECRFTLVFLTHMVRMGPVSWVTGLELGKEPLVVKCTSSLLPYIMEGYTESFC